MKYKFTIKGKSKTDGKYYISECYCDGMSKDEKEQFIKEQNFLEGTITFKKEKVKK